MTHRDVEPKPVAANERRGDVRGMLADSAEHTIFNNEQPAEPNWVYLDSTASLNNAHP